MKRIIISIFILFSINVFSQDPQTHFILEDEIPSNVTKEYIGRDFVQMVPGFHSKPDPSFHVLAKTDPRLVFPPEGGDLTGGSTNNNEGGVVGTLPGNLMVSPSGAAVYNIPISVPAGINGMSPSINLVYNSQGGNGLLGIGWSLSGLSAITRTGTNLYHEDYIDGVDFDANDKLSLDGQRLIPLEEETEFRTEIETFSKIIPHGNFAGMPEWYEVFTKDGRIIEYGNTVNSRIETADGSHVFMWYINKVTDRKGNYLVCEYIEEGGLGRISKIKYTGNINTNLETFYEVNFNYTDTRDDPIKKYISGKAVEINILLEDIKIKYNNSVIHTYTLQYDDDSFYSRLSSVTLSNADDIHYNPTICQWGDDGGHERERLILSKETVPNDWYIDQYFLDINGDGLSDVIRIEYTMYEANGYEARKAENWYFRLRLDDDTFSEKYSFNKIPSNFYRTLMIGDFNGDGLQDFLDLEYTHEKKEKTVIKRMFISQGNSFVEYRFDHIEWWENNRPEFRIGDFDGDGISELLIAYKDIPENYDSDPDNDINNVYVWKFSEAEPYSRYAFYGQTGFGNTGFDGSVLIVGDFNGDGCSDFLRTAEYGAAPGGSNTSNCFIYSIDFITPELDWIYGSGYPTVWHQIFPGDFNGDGITDLLTYNYTAANPIWQVSCFNGSNAFVSMADAPPLHHFNPYETGEGWSYGVNIADYNGDSKTDIMELAMILDPLDPYKAEYNIFYSNGDNFGESSTGIIRDLNGLVLGDRHTFTFNDFNGDNKADLYTLGVIGVDYIHLFDHTNDYNLIKNITNGLGHETTIIYNPLTNNLIYDRNPVGDWPDYPVSVIQPALYVVTAIEKDNAIGNVFETNYTYKGAKIHKKGKGFLGFNRTIEITNPDTEKTTKLEKTYNINADYFFPYLSMTHQYADIVGEENKLIKQTSYGSKVKDFGDKRIFYYNWDSYIWMIHTGDENSTQIKTVRSKQSFNEGNDINFGNVSNISVYTTGSNWDDYSTITDFTYDYNFIDDWIIHRVETVTTATESIDDPTSFIDTKEVTFAYSVDDPSFIESKTHKPNGNQTMRTVSSNIYDDYGNIINTTLSAPGFSPAPPARITNYTYSSEYQYRFVTQTDKTVGDDLFLSTTSYYPSTGQIQSSTDINNNTTNYYYDGFGRLDKTIFPDGIISKQGMYWSNNLDENPTHGLHRLWTQSSGMPESFIYFDNLGRELQVVSKNYNDNQVYTENEYNSFGQLDRTSVPHYSNEEKQWTSYTYLSTGNVKTVISPTSNITYAYNGRITQTTDNNTGITTSNETNPIGNIIKATDPGGTIEYTYLSSGQLYTSIVGNNTTTILYDEAGFQKSLDDPDAGTTEYKFNPFGELLTQTNANLLTYEMTYDGLGRILSKILQGSVDDIVYYTYYPQSTYGFGQIKSITQSNGTAVTNEYDKYSRIIKKTQTIDSKEYVFNYEYNILGETKKITWPSGFAVNYHYKNGYFSGVEQTSTGIMLWELYNTNAKEQITQYMLGNRLLTTKGFDTYGFPLSILTENSVQNHTYEFNVNTSNLTSRSSVIYPPHGSHTLTEDFTYDDTKFNNRLETWKVDIGQLYSMGYNINGNIETKTDVGTFIYNGIEEGPHAVTLIENPSAAYLENAIINEQHITYTAFDKTKAIWNENSANPEDSKVLEITYGPNQSRYKTEVTEHGENIETKYYIGGLMEIEQDANNNTRELHYISAGDGLCAIYVIDNNNDGSMYYIHKDYLGSIETITNEEAVIVERLSFDPWGRRRNVTNWSYDNVPTTFMFDRGYTGHEHIDEFNLINMNGRVYDPILGRFLSPDNYVQAPYHTQSFNRYSYVLNNPLKYTDPSGEIIWAPIIIGAVIGTYMGGTLANNDYNPGNWDYGSGKTWGYMAGGAIVGGLSGYVGGAIAASEIPMANTLGIAGASYTNSIGTNMYTDGQTDISVSLGVASYNFSSGNWGYLGKPENKWYQNVAYSFGALANIQDLAALNMGGSVNYNSLKDPVGHGSLTNDKGTIDISKGHESGSLLWGKGTKWGTAPKNQLFPKLRINNVNEKILEWMSGNIAADKGIFGVSELNYGLIGNTCTSQVSRALWGAGVWGLNPFTISPHSLYLQIFARQVGIYSSSYLYQIPNH
ncbi:MAG: RHS repeat-associated core domain-containing protein [Bacteroidota bacterium]